MDQDIYRNVGTPGHPLTWLHQRAIALLYGEISLALKIRGKVFARTQGADKDEWTQDLTAGGQTVSIPSDLTPIGGISPDLAVYQGHQPVRVIEVVVTNPPNPTKMDHLKSLRQRGVDVAVIRIQTLEDLTNLCWDHSNRERSWSPDLREPPEYPHHANARFARRGNAGWPGQANYNGQIAEFINGLLLCEPAIRRQLADVLKALPTLDSVYPLSQHNPLYESLKDLQQPTV